MPIRPPEDEELECEDADADLDDSTGVVILKELVETNAVVVPGTRFGDLTVKTKGRAGRSGRVPIAILSETGFQVLVNNRQRFGSIVIDEPGQEMELSLELKDKNGKRKKVKLKGRSVPYPIKDDAQPGYLHSTAEDNGTFEFGVEFSSLGVRERAAILAFIQDLKGVATPPPEPCAESVVGETDDGIPTSTVIILDRGSELTEIQPDEKVHARLQTGDWKEKYRVTALGQNGCELQIVPAKGLSAAEITHGLFDTQVSTCQLELKIPGKGTLRVEGQTDRASSDVKNNRVFLDFTNITPADREAIHRYVTRATKEAQPRSPAQVSGVTRRHVLGALGLAVGLISLAHEAGVFLGRHQSGTSAPTPAPVQPQTTPSPSPRPAPAPPRELRSDCTVMYNSATDGYRADCGTKLPRIRIKFSPDGALLSVNMEGETTASEPCELQTPQLIEPRQPFTVLPALSFTCAAPPRR